MSDVRSETQSPHNATTAATQAGTAGLPGTPEWIEQQARSDMTALPEER